MEASTKEPVRNHYHRCHYLSNWSRLTGIVVLKSCNCTKIYDLIETNTNMIYRNIQINIR